MSSRAAAGTRPRSDGDAAGREGTQRWLSPATQASFRSRVPLPASSCGERETRSAGEGRFPRLDLPSAAPSSAFGTSSPQKPRGRRTLDVTKARERSKENLRGARRIYGLVVQRTQRK